MDKIINFIKEIREFNEYKRPSHIKIICGCSEYFQPIQKYKQLDGIEIDVYEKFEYYSFLLDNKCDYIGSDTLVWNILCGGSIDIKKFFNFCKGLSKEEYKVSMLKIVNYLFFNDGIVLINRDKNKKCFEVFKNYKVDDVLFVGPSVPYKSYTKYFPTARIGVISHPSRRVSKSKKSIYYTLDSSEISEVTYFNKKFEKTKLEKFKLKFFNRD